jgi:hypothetical protein
MAASFILTCTSETGQTTIALPITGPFPPYGFCSSVPSKLAITRDRGFGLLKSVQINAMVCRVFPRLDIDEYKRQEHHRETNPMASANMLAAILDDFRNIETD